MLNFNKKFYLYIAIIFFLILNWGAVYFSWQGRSLPPEPDDSGIFLTLIYAHSKYGNIFSPQVKIFNIPWQWDETGGVDKSSYFSWAFLWGNVSKLVPVNKEIILQLSFYMGIVLFLFAIVYFFKQEERHFKTLIIVLIALFTGDGLYHGLYWPTASLYSVSLFLIISRLIIDGRKYWWLKIILLLPFFLLTHPLSVVAIFSLVIFSLIYLLIKRSNAIVGRSLIVFSISLAIYFLWIKYLSVMGVLLVTMNGNILYFVTSQLLKGKISILGLSIKNIFDKYILFLLTRPFFCSILGLGIINIVKKDKNILILYLSFIILMSLGLLFVGGEKILLYIWVLTFIIMAYGLEYLLLFLKKQIKNINAKINRLTCLLLINIPITLVWAVTAMGNGSIKDNILGKLFTLIFLIFISIVVITRAFMAKKLWQMLIIFSLIEFFSYLFLEKVAMTIFLRQRMDFSFDKNTMLSVIKSKKKDIIAYNDNQSFAIFSGLGLIESTVVKTDNLDKDTLKQVDVFIALKAKCKICQSSDYTFNLHGLRRTMFLRLQDSNFVIYKFD
jgi:hypothetical protein